MCILNVIKHILHQWFLIFSKSGNTFDYMKNLRNTKINEKTNKNIPRKNKYILENILLNIFKFYILKCIIKFLQSHNNNKKQKFGFYNFAEHRLRTSVLYFLYFIVTCKFTLCDFSINESFDYCLLFVLFWYYLLWLFQITNWIIVSECCIIECIMLLFFSKFSFIKWIYIYINLFTLYT